jgi:methyl-accepting chemotaxis protein
MIMKIKTKMILGSCLLVLLPGILIGGLIGVSVSKSSSHALEESAAKELIAVREVTRQSIEKYFQGVENQIINLSQSNETVAAISVFSHAFGSYFKGKNAKDFDEKKQNIKAFYEQQFNKRFIELNNGNSSDVEGLFNQLKNTTVVLQNSYIAENPNPLGEKDKLLQAGKVHYDRTHSKYHPFFRDLLQRFGYYDIFLVSADTGHIVYSVFKELDYATSLIDGPYADSGIADAYRAALKQPSGSAVITDFKPYLPSYNAHAAFTAAPIYREEKLLGVLIFQIPVDEIDVIMTHNQQWKNVGLGNSGETYLVSEDGTVRSNRRSFVEDPDIYLQTMRELGLDENTVQKIKANGNSMGIQPVDTEGFHTALAGESGVKVFDDYRGVPVMSAYAPANIAGLNWVLMSEIDEAEATASVSAIQTGMLTTLLISVACLAALGAVLGVIFSKVVVNPINETVNLVRDIAEGEGDLRQRLPHQGNSELDELALWFNRFMDDLQKIIGEIQSSSTQLASASTELAHNAQETGHQSNEQLNKSAEVATSTTQLSAAIREVALNTKSADELSKSAQDGAEQGSNMIVSSASSIDGLAAEISKSANVINQLRQDVSNIEAVLDVIEDIADQTNLLALNAAIEAARAGEQGRGFSVVADEVRTLASRTRSSTDEIKQMIEVLQNGAEKAVSVMMASQETTYTCVEQSESVKANFAFIRESVDQMTDMMSQISTSTEEQSAAVDEVNKNISEMTDIMNVTTQGAEQSLTAANELATISEQMQALSSRYKV